MRNIVIAFGLTAILAASWASGRAGPAPEEPPILAIAAIRNGISQILVVDAKGKIIAEPTYTGGAHSPSWSPDGKQILFTNRADDGSMHVFVVNTDGQGLQKITDETGWNVWPTWSPDGRYIAYANYSAQPGRPGSEHGRLAIRDLIEDTPTPAALSELQCGARPAWKPKKR